MAIIGSPSAADRATSACICVLKQVVHRENTLFNKSYHRKLILIYIINFILSMYQVHNYTFIIINGCILVTHDFLRDFDKNSHQLC